MPEKISSQQRGAQKPIVWTHRSAPQASIECELEQLMPLALQVVSEKPEIREWNELVDRHHYLGYRRPIGPHLRYFIVDGQGRRLGALMFCYAVKSLPCRDEWIGWQDQKHKKHLDLVVSNNRFLILPWVRVKNLASKSLSMACRRLADDWRHQHAYRPVLIETFVDAQHFDASCYRAASWTQVGATKGYRRIGAGYGARTESVKWVFVQALQRDARRILSAPLLEPRYRTGVERMELTHNDMRSLYDHFTGVPDVRRAKGRKHNLANVLALAAGATLSGMRGYKDIWVWASTLSQASRTRFRCRFRNRRREVPSLTVIRNVMIQVGPEALDRAINNWLAEHYGDAHEASTATPIYGLLPFCKV